MTPEQKDSKYQDLITKSQVAVKVIRDQSVIEKLYDENYEPIIVILRDGPLTIKELYKKYNEHVGKKEEKSEMTIYRYVKELDKVDIVTEVGKRVKTGQSATQTLYGRTAKLFWNLKDKDDYWNKPKSRKTLEALRELLVIYKDDTNISADNLAALLIKTSKISSEEVAAFFEENNEEVNKIISGFSFKEADKLFDILASIILFINSADFSEELEKCGC